ncbi:precorrin-8X methylmutase [Clostridium sp. Marseille-P2415]|uniref:precorrin-8X methylmutase n=1 Tax=Clostridium sp. Marseille-P2415 TaxID=1805471 RepID=UPI00190E7692|nr:precorrin-8X methylmutase [Clostridium sp. Marseille-P2415]
MKLYELERVLPEEIEKRSFELITMELGEKTLDPENELVIKRVIHTTADFDYAENLVFSPHAVKKGLEALKEGIRIITDTNMGKAGINKGALNRLRCSVDCFMADEDVAEYAKLNRTTRACASMDKAAGLSEDCIIAVGNAPTALVRLYELIKEGKIRPRLIIGVPVGFVNVVQSKEMIMSLSDVPFIVAKGRKGGSNVAAAIVNALLYQIQ